MPRVTLGRAAILAATLLLQPVIPVQAEEASLAAPPDISHLITYIERSECEFIRHGLGYGGGIAAEYIWRKYVAMRDQIGDAEDFIARVATLSEKGEPYRVRCPGQDSIAAAGWLRAELRTFRNQAAEN